MPDTVAVRKPSIDLSALTTKQKLDLIGKLRDSIAAADEAPLSQGDRDELDRRMADLDNGKVRTVPLTKAMRQLRKGLRTRPR